MPVVVQARKKQDGVDSALSFRLNPPEIMNADEAAVYLTVSRMTLRRLIVEFGLPVRRVGDRLLFSKTKIDEWVQAPGEADAPVDSVE